MIDPKDLILMKGSEIKPGFTFYRKDDDGFHRCCFSEEELQDPEQAQYLRLMTRKYSEENRLYKRRSAPGRSFE